MKNLIIAMTAFSTLSAFADPVEYICEENQYDRYLVQFDLEKDFAQIFYLTADGKPAHGAIASKGVTAQANKVTAMIAAGAGESVELFYLVKTCDGKAAGTYFDPFSGNAITLDCELSN